jgi:hypothetical protein
MKRLALIKYLFDKAVEQSRMPGPMGVFSLLTFQDSVELFLGLACESHGINVTKKTPFMDHWNLLKNVTPSIKLTQEATMERMNNARVSLKHHGQFPTKFDIEIHRASTQNFFQDNSRIVFGIDFQSISMVEVVANPKVRSLLQIATQKISDGKAEEAIYKIAEAFAILVDDHENGMIDKYGRSLFQFGSPYFGGLNSIDDDVATYLSGLSDLLNNMEEIIKIILLKIDYEAYSRFIAVTPKAHKVEGRFVFSQTFEPLDISLQDCHFSMQFVINCALALQDKE